MRGYLAACIKLILGTYMSGKIWRKSWNISTEKLLAKKPPLLDWNGWRSTLIDLAVNLKELKK